jgi:hypothetical protein
MGHKRAMKSKATAKRILGEVPLSADIYWLLRQSEGAPTKNYYLNKLDAALPHWVDQVTKSRDRSNLEGKKILIFAALHYWISHITLVGSTLSGLGHDVNLMYLPFARWEEPINRFDLRRQDLYTKGVLQKANSILNPISLLDVKVGNVHVPKHLEKQVEKISLRDTQYTLQQERVYTDSSLYRLRLARNRDAAQKALHWMMEESPEVVVIPNGSILEMGIVYEVAKYLGIPTITYEFGEQRNRIWLALNKEVMRQETNDLWESLKDRPFPNVELEKVRDLFDSRQKADLWKNFSRQWQVVPSQGGDQVRQTLGLDERPVVVLAANVIGDSLTLDRQLFSDSMTEWLERTVKFFAERSDLQLVVRIHPGERYAKGPSVADTVNQALQMIPENIHFIHADDETNTYDLLEIADIGLVYTTTVGLEMAMSGVPVLVVGQTHYRGKGFTFDPDSWENYFARLVYFAQDQKSFRLTPEQIELAWKYAYVFFFEYPAPFPWPMPKFWKELEEWPIERVLSAEGMAEYGDTFHYLVGEPRSWTDS